MNVDAIDWNAVIAVLNERFPLQLEIAMLTVRLTAAEAANYHEPDPVKD